MVRPRLWFLPSSIPILLPPSPLAGKGGAGEVPDVGTKCGIKAVCGEQLELDREIPRDPHPWNRRHLQGQLWGSAPWLPQELQQRPREQGRIFSASSESPDNSYRGFFQDNGD